LGFVLDSITLNFRVVVFLVAFVEETANLALMLRFGFLGVFVFLVGVIGVFVFFHLGMMSVLVLVIVIAT